MKVKRGMKISNSRNKVRDSCARIILSRTSIVLIITVMIILSLMNWQTELKNKQDQLYRRTDSAAISLATKAATRFQRINNAIRQLSRLGELNLSEEGNIWAKDAEFIIDTYTGIRSISWIDPQMKRLKLITSQFEGNTADQMEAADDEKLIELWFPVFEGSELIGFNLGIIDIVMMMDALFDEYRGDFGYRLSQNNGFFYAQGEELSSNEDFQVKKSIILPDSAVLFLNFAPEKAVVTAMKFSAARKLIYLMIITAIMGLALVYAKKYHILSSMNAARFRDMLETVELAAVMIDMEGRITFCNDFLLHMLNYSQDEVIGKNWSNILNPANSNNSQLLLNARDGKLPDEKEIVIKTKQGELRYVMMNWTLLRNSKNQVDGLAGIGEDVTIRKEVEEALYLQSSALNAMTDAVMIIDQNGDIEWVNPAASKMKGCAAEDMIGRNIQQFSSGQDSEEWCEHFRDILKSGNFWREEFQNKRKDGSVYTEIQTITPVKKIAGRIDHFVSIEIDISDQRNLQDENKKLAEEFYQSQRIDAIGKLSGGIAHDFNNLLVPILGYAEMGMDQFSSDTDVYKKFELITEAAMRGSDLTKQILAFSRQQITEVLPLNLNAVITDVESMLRRLIGENVELEMELADDLHVINGDRGQIEQILLNLAVNANDAMSETGVVKFRTENVETMDLRNYYRELCNFQLKIPAEGRWVVMTVTDTGVGMDQQTVEKIFDPFFTTKPKGKGTGLGLSTVARIVEQHGGSISTCSEIHKGTSFHVFFPAAEKAMKEKKTQNDAITVPVHGQETILLVEDDEHVRSMMADALRSYGYTVLDAAHPIAGLKLITQYTDAIDLVLSDVIMPYMNGISMLKRIRKTLPSVKVLFMSGYTNVEISKEIMNRSDAAFMSKPFKMIHLLRKIRLVLNKEVEE